MNLKGLVQSAAEFLYWAKSEIDFGQNVYDEDDETENDNGNEPEEVRRDRPDFLSDDYDEQFEEDETGRAQSRTMLVMRFNAREIVFFSSIVSLFVIGWFDVTIQIFANCGAMFVVLAMILNPFYVFERILPPPSRVCISTSIIIVQLAFQLQFPIYFRVCAALISVLLIALVVLMNKEWISNHGFLQSRSGDIVASHWKRESKKVNGKEVVDYTDSGSYEALRAWNKYGCRRSRALLHQTMNISVDENMIRLVCKLTYLLGYTDGAENGGSEQIPKLQKQIDDLKWSNGNLRRYSNRILDNEDSVDSMRDKLRDAKTESSQLRMFLAAEQRKSKTLRDQNDALRLELEDALARIIELEEEQTAEPVVEEPEVSEIEQMFLYWGGGKKEGGRSLQEVADKFGVSKATADRRIKEMKEIKNGVQ